MLDKLFLCVGAQKSGTTWLHSQLENHPEIHFSDVKEVHYFNTIHNGSILLSRRKVEHLDSLIKNNRYALERYFSDLSSGATVNPGIHRLLSPVDDEWYESLFGSPTGQYPADFSPEYALLPKEGYEHIRRIAHHIKILFIMRDPIARARSAIQYHFQGQGLQPDRVTPDEIRDLARQDFIVQMSNYKMTLENLANVFEEEQLKFMFFEEMMEDKKHSLKSIQDFLSIEYQPPIEDITEKRVNTSARINFPPDVIDELRHKLDSTYEYVKQMFGYYPSSWSR